jgi:hypothetical protein
MNYLLPFRTLCVQRYIFFLQIARIYLKILTLFAHKKCSFFHGSRYIMYGNSPEQLKSITNDEQKSFVLAVLAFLR